MDERILLAHGGGGILTRELIEGTIVPAFGTGDLPLPDAAPVPGADNILLTTDSFVVKPLFFPGGDIGTLSVYGTVNDLAVSGAEPLALSLALIVEEGLPIETLREVLKRTAQAAEACNVRIITGDTKVVERGKVERLFVTTAGVGLRRIEVGPDRLREGDAVLLSGPIADHGIAVLSEREGLGFRTSVQSDAAPVWPFVRALIQERIEIHAMRDPTRGGLAACCVELAETSGVSIQLVENSIPLRAQTRAACEMLGLDPLSIANEGKLVAFVARHDASRALEALRRVPGGEMAAVVGTVTARSHSPVVMKTALGGARVVEMPYGEELPRIC